MSNKETSPFDGAFVSRHSECISTEEIQKIMDAYKDWHEIQADQPEVYQVSREWLPIYQQYLTETVDAFLSNNLDFIKHAFENFFRHPISTGLHGLHFQMTEIYMNPDRRPSVEEINRYAESSLLGLKTFLLTCPNVPLEKLARKPVGNPYGYKLNEFEVFPSAEYHCAFAQKINMLVRKFDRPTILEIGGGYGGLAYYCLVENPRMRIVLSDLPENAALQAFYLKSMFPNKKIKLYGEVEIDGDFDILITPNFALEEISENSVELTFNSYSLAEMSRETVNRYINIICNVTSHYFYHLNHVFWEMSSDTFPIDFDKFDLLFRNPTLWGKDPRAYQMDQHEYLYIAKD
jgi:putative sugar O-methyltransferase